MSVWNALDTHFFWTGGGGCTGMQHSQRGETVSLFEGAPSVTETSSAWSALKPRPFAAAAATTAVAAGCNGANAAGCNDDTGEYR